MRLINADAYADHMENALKESILEVDLKSIQEFLIAAEVTKAVVLDLRDEKITPTVDAVPVVRCKNCKYKVTTRDGEWNPEDVVCTYWATDGLCAEDYCSQGKEGQYEFD